MENEFDKVLENGVNDDTLLMKLENELKEERKNVITDPEKVKKLEKRIKYLKTKTQENPVTVKQEEKRIESKSLEDIKKEKEEKEKIQKEQEDTDEKQPDKEEDASTVKAYEDAIQKLHDYRIQTINRQIDERRLVCNEQEFIKDVELEKKKIALKAALTEEERSQVRAKEEKLNQEERMAKDKIESEVRQRNRKYADNMLKLHKVNLELKYIHKLQEENKIPPEEYEKRKEIALSEQTKVKDEIEKLNPKELVSAMEEQNKMDKTRKQVLGKNYEQEEYEQASDEEKENLKYAKGKKLRQEQDLKFAEKEKLDNPKQRIEERQTHMENLRKELDYLPEDDIERRMEILMEMEEENALLEHDQEKMDRIKSGREISAKEEMKENRKIKKEQEEIKEQNIKDYKETQEAIKVMEKEEGREAIANPTDPNRYEKIKEEARSEAREKAVVGGVIASQIIGDENDTLSEDIMQGTIVGHFIAHNEFEKSLHEKTVNVEDPKEARAYIEKQEAIDELNKNQKAIEKDIQTK